MLTFGVLVKTKHCNGAVHLTNEPPFYFPLEPVYRSLLFKEELNLNFNDIAYATLLGALSGGLFEGIAQVTASGRGGSAALETGKFSADTDGYLGDGGKDYFAGVEDVGELGKTYHELAKQNHPDAGGKNSVMAEISKQYGMKKAFYEAKKAVASAGPSLAQAEGGSAQALSALSTSGMDEGILSPYNNTLAMQGSRAYTGGKGTDILNSTAWGQGLSAGGAGDVLRTHPLGPTALEMVTGQSGTVPPMVSGYGPQTGQGSAGSLSSGDMAIIMLKKLTDTSSPLSQGNESPLSPHRIYNAYLEMLDELDAARKSGMTAREYAMSKGVPSSLSDEDAAIWDEMELRMEDAGGDVGKFAEMTPDEAMKIAQEYRTRAPIEIPESATITPASKAGYEQISYNWRDGTFKYEVRWHTRTPGAPTNQGNTWVVERITPGSGGIPPKSEILSGGQWISRYEWQKAIKAYQKGTATQRQLQILEQGHWKE